ncbi:MAG TPA: ATP synthase F1 subunit gamma [Dictyoglomaceae bacterium]|nr:ATP synthase F1 subunit gamma [Dictyoglomaceae bacterium]HOL39290.1 ATP synthase F1 subunit gamma [Dictyoglomaceae bacterium]HPP15851.1 ATP synthase F1 subunit gamma [Dictyoglomaceae bacterium]
MPTLQQLRRKVKSIENITHIVRSMETLSMVKIRALQDKALRLKPYTEELNKILSELVFRLPEEYANHPLIKERPVYKTGILLVTSDLGFCGSYNLQIQERLEKFLENKKTQNINFYALGSFAQKYLSAKKLNIIKSYPKFLEDTSFSHARVLARELIQDFLDEKIDELYAVYFNFINIVKQEVTVQKILPMIPVENIEKKEEFFIFLPSLQNILDPLLRDIIETDIHQIILDSAASEQAFRRFAMKRAHENAEKLQTKLVFQLNQVRQNQITRELLDITSSIETLKEEVK